MILNFLKASSATAMAFSAAAHMTVGISRTSVIVSLNFSFGHHMSQKNIALLLQFKCRLIHIVSCKYSLLCSPAYRKRNNCTYTCRNPNRNPQFNGYRHFFCVHSDHRDDSLQPHQNGLHLRQKPVPLHNNFAQSPDHRYDPAFPQ